MIVEDVTELDIVDVLHRGVANRECIAIAVEHAVNLGRYGLMIAQHDATVSKNSVPFFDNLFWFGDGLVKAGDWLFVYTGPGSPRRTQSTSKFNDIFTLHWGKKRTMFASTMVVPVLFRVDAVNILLPPSDQTQLPRLSN